MDASNFLNIVLCHNNSFSPLARHLCRTISHPQIKIHRKVAEFGSEGFRSPGWYKFVRMKVEILKKTIGECENGSVVGMIDSDIQCFSPESLVKVWKMMVSSEYNYVGLTESCCRNPEGLWFEPQGEDSNTGFILVKKNAETEKFLNDVLSKTFEEKFLGDQNAINESLRHMKLKRALLNPCLFFHGWCGNPRKDIILHHATGTANAQQKMDQINWVRQQVGAEPVNWNNPSFGSSCT